MELYYDYVLKEDHTVCVYKIYGTNPIVELDDTINGYPVSELGEYCFSSMRKLNKDTLKTYDTLPIGYVELTGKFIQSVKLSNSIKKIGNCTFYNCRNLDCLYISSNLKDIGFDAFMNCTKLKHVYINCSVYEKTYLSFLLAQINWDIDIHFEDMKLFYPEYIEMYDEVGPAHLFGLNISGEGYRMRKCFQNGIVELDKYDQTFMKLKGEEKMQVVCHFVLNRVIYGNCSMDMYIDFIKDNPMEISKYMYDYEIDHIEKIITYLNSDCMNYLIELASKDRKVELQTKLIVLKKKYFEIKKNKYTFEDF